MSERADGGTTTLPRHDHADTVNGTSAQPETVVIAGKFRGPPNSGNGGYVSGTFAGFLHPRRPVEVTLRSPVPLDKPMTVTRSEDPIPVTVTDDETLIAEIRPADLSLDVPAPPTTDDVRRAAPASPSLAKRENPIIPGARGFHPICFCCGVEHEDGLGVYAAPIEGGAQVAALWQTNEAWADEEGNLPENYLWAALDCPGQFAWYAAGTLTGMLGRMTAEVLRSAPAGETYRVIAWPVEVEGKKHFAGSAIFDANDALIARAKTVWIGRRDMNMKRNLT